MPSAYDPPSGIVATANQNTFGSGFPFRITGTFADPYRIRQIRARLNAKRGLTVPDMLAVQKDVYSAYDRFLAQEITKAIGSATPGSLEAEALPVLRSWNGQMEKDEAAPVITQLVSAELARGLVLSCLPQRTDPSSRAAARNNVGRPQGAQQISVTGYMPRPFTIESLLRERPAGWAPQNDWNGWLRKALHEALQRGRQRQGTPVAHWRWGRMLQWTFAHPVGKQLPLVDRFFDIGPVEMSGSGSTVKQTTATLGPSERMVVDLGALDRSVQNLTTGESGSVASGHYKDQWLAYYSGRSFPMQFQSVDAKEILHIRPDRESR
jgi:penicillin amidase